jgi:hypothetical protein
MVSGLHKCQASDLFTYSSLSWTCTSPFVLPTDHYFFVPQVKLSNGDFFWLSAPRPITGGTGPFLPDLQSWIRNGDLAPDWSRIGTDIVGGSPAPTFNAAFSLTGRVPDAGSGAALFGLALLAMIAARRLKKELRVH